MSVRFQRWNGVAGFVVIAVMTLAAQQPPVFRAQTELVEIPVTVINADGVLLQGLSKDDFRCTVDGKPVVIRNLDVVQAPSSLPSLTQAGPDVYSNEAAARPAQRLVLLIDYEHTPVHDLPNLRLQLKKWFQQPLPPALEVAIFALDGGVEVLQPFTHDHKRLAAAVDGMVAFHAKGASSVSVQRNLQLLDDFEMERMDPSQGPGLMADISGSPAADNGPGSNAAIIGTSDVQAGPMGLTSKRGLREEQRAMVQDQYRNTMQALLQLADLLEGVPGRKPVIWLTTQTSLEVQWNPDTEFSSDARDMAFAHLNEANIALFPLDVDGLGGNNSLADAALEKLPSTQASDGTTLERIGMDWAASWTGGRSFVHTNGFTNVFDKVVALGSESYVLSFIPPPALKGHPYRNVRVELTHPPHGAQVLYRRQYLQPEIALAEMRLKSGLLQQLRRASLVPMEMGGIPVAAHVAPGKAKQGRSMNFALVIPYDGVLHDHINEGQINGSQLTGFDFTCFRVLVPMDDPAHILILKPWRFQKQLSPSEATQWRNQAAVYRSQVDAPPGHLYLVRLIVHDNLTGAMGTVSFRLDARTGRAGH